MNPRTQVTPTEVAQASMGARCATDIRKWGTALSLQVNPRRRREQLFHAESAGFACARGWRGRTVGAYIQSGAGRSDSFRRRASDLRRKEQRMLLNIEASHQGRAGQPGQIVADATSHQAASAS